MHAIALFDSKNSKWSDGLDGFVHFYQPSANAPTRVHYHIKGFKPNAVHASHIHEFGDTSEGCMSAGAHYNPFHQEHGSSELDGKKRHVGDLVNNISADKDGVVKLRFNDNLVSLLGRHSVLGRTVVIHEDVDDLGRGGNKESKKTGNAGGRMACAIIGVAEKEPG
jgi:superoxide dismutase, Cu-Zn family